MDIGRLNRRVLIQRRDPDAVDAAGQPVESWLPFAEVWADIRFQGGLEAIRAGAQTSVAAASIRIRFRTDITSAMRVVDGAAVYAILAVLPNVGTKEYTDLVCEVRNG